MSCRVFDPELQGSYVGGCVNGLADGYGEARGIAQYIGEFKAGRKHGKGVKTWPSGDRYEGEFADDRKQGSGMYTWGRGSPNPGERYIGGYVNDRRQGYGVYEWPDGERYEGPWDNDRIAGPPTRGMIARARAEAERRASVGRVGMPVCREMQVGVAIRDPIRGTVLAVEGSRIRVRIDEAGEFEHVIGDQPVTRGATIDDSMLAWTPCVAARATPATATPRPAR